MDPQAGKAVILEFLQMLCGGDTAQYTRLLDWLTHALQQSNAPGETALCVSGYVSGCGKSQLWKIIRHLLQAHGRCIDMGAHELRRERKYWLLRDTACFHIGECQQHEFRRLVPRLCAVIDKESGEASHTSQLQEPAPTVVTLYPSLQQTLGSWQPRGNSESDKETGHGSSRRLGGGGVP